jgi:hypothetical protein
MQCVNARQSVTMVTLKFRATVSQLHYFYMYVRMVKESGKDLPMYPWSEEYCSRLLNHATESTALCELT